jgi:hypothetical protein
MAGNSPYKPRVKVAPPTPLGFGYTSDEPPLVSSYMEALGEEDPAGRTTPAYLFLRDQLTTHMKEIPSAPMCPAEDRAVARWHIERELLTRLMRHATQPKQ